VDFFPKKKITKNQKILKFAIDSKLN